MIERVLQRDLWAKIAAVALALLMWFYVSSRQNPLETRHFNVRLEISSAPGKVVMSHSPDTAVVTLQGRASTLDKIDAETLSIPVDIASLNTGPNQVPLAFSSPVGGVNVTDINPKVANVTLDVEDAKPVNVMIQTKGQPNEEYEAQVPTPALSTVKVVGPRTQVDKVVAVTGTVDITGVAGSVSGRQVTLTAVDAQNNAVSGVHVDPREVAVSVPMTSRPPAKIVAVNAETSGSPKIGYKVKSVTIDPEAIKVRGEDSDTRYVSSISTRPVDVSGRTETFTYQANLVIPKGVSSQVQRVNVTVEIEEDIVKATFRNVFVQFESLPAGFTFQIKPQTVDVRIVGRSDIVATINESDIQAFIDTSWVKGAGSHKMVVNVKGLPDSVRIDDISPSHVILELVNR